MLKINLKKTYGGERGFTLLFAVLVSTLVVSIGASIISIALRQTILSGTSRESQYAFYAANTVLECAFFWDITGGSEGGAVFPVTGQVPVSTEEIEAINCSGINIVNGDDAVLPVVPPWDRVGDVTTFYLRVSDITNGGSGYEKGNGEPLNVTPRCAQATITKTESDGVITTRIDARGYNTCDTSNPRRVERGLVQEYQS